MSRPLSRRSSLSTLDASLPDLRESLSAAFPDLEGERDMQIDNPPDWEEEEIGIWGTWLRVWPAALGVMVVFWTTLAVFPGVVTRIPSMGYDPRNWMPVILIATFNVGDLIGRYSAGVLESMISVYILNLMIVARVGIVPALVYLQLHPSILPGYYDAAAIGSVLVLALTNGLCASLTLIKGQRQVQPGQQNETASTILTLAMCLGLVLGALAALPIAMLSTHYTPANRA